MFFLDEFAKFNNKSNFCYFKGLSSDSEYVSSLDEELHTEQRLDVNQGAIFVSLFAEYSNL